MTNKEYLRKLNMKLNRRMLNAERKGYQGLKSYKAVKEIAQEVGTKSRKGITRFKERTAKLSEAQVNEYIKKAEKALTYTDFLGAKGKKEKAKLIDIKEKFKKGGFTVSEEAIDDLLEGIGTGDLKEYFSSDEIIDMYQEYEGMDFWSKTEAIMSGMSGKEFDEDEFRKAMGI